MPFFSKLSQKQIIGLFAGLFVVFCLSILAFVQLTGNQKSSQQNNSLANSEQSVSFPNSNFSSNSNNSSNSAILSTNSGNSSTQSSNTNLVSNSNSTDKPSNSTLNSQNQSLIAKTSSQVSHNSENILSEKISNSDKKIANLSSKIDGLSSKDNLQVKDFDVIVVFFENKDGGTCSGLLEGSIIKTISHCFDSDIALNFENVITINKNQVNILLQKKVNITPQKNSYNIISIDKDVVVGLGKPIPNCETCPNLFLKTTDSLGEGNSGSPVF